MRVYCPRIFAVLDPEGSSRRVSARAGMASPVASARSTIGEASSERHRLSNPAAAIVGRLLEARLLETARSSQQAVAQAQQAVKDSAFEEYSAFDMLHTERGFSAFEQWYKRVLVSGAGASAPPLPQKDFGLLWPQAFCPPNALHEYAFMELVRAFADCSDSDAFDFFDILDYDFLGVLGLPQVYLGMCLIAAIGSRQLTKLLYFHSTNLFLVLSKGCVEVPAERIAWPRVLTFLRLLGAPESLISRTVAGSGMHSATQLTYDDFLDVVYPIVVALDRGSHLGEGTVINENDRALHVRSKLCSIL